MSSHSYSLHAFEETPSTSPFALKGLIETSASELRIKSDLIGPLEELVIPPQSKDPQRRSNLWENTCLEVFISAAKSHRYWEWNFSPSLDWNMFQFKDYRNKDSELLSGWQHQASRLISGKQMQLNIQIDIPETLRDTPLHIGVSFVLHHKQNGLTYWALQHLSQQPDFHNRGKFLIHT